MVDYKLITEKSLKFAFSPRKWLQFFVVDSVFFLLFLLLLSSDWLSNISAFILVSVNPSIFTQASIFPIIIPFILLGVVWLLIRLFITGAVVHQAYKPGFDKSYAVSRQKYFSILLSAIIVSLILNLVGSVPFIGFILTIIFALIFFVPFQAIIINKNTGFYKGLQISWNIFRHRPKEIIITFIIVALISLLIIGVFSIPLILIYSSFVVPTLAGADANVLSLLIIYMVTNLPNVIASGLAFLLGGSIVYSFTLKAQTEIYLKLRKKKLFIF